MTYLNILLIALTWVFILDISGFWWELSTFLSRFILPKGMPPRPFDLKPFSCSLCMTFWTSLVYVICIGEWSWVMMAYICVVAWLTPRIQDGMRAIDFLLVKLIKLIRHDTDTND